MTSKDPSRVLYEHRGLSALAFLIARRRVHRGAGKTLADNKRGSSMKITGTELIAAKHDLFVKVHTDAGLTGLGEAGNWGFLDATEPPRTRISASTDPSGTGNSFADTRGISTVFTCNTTKA